MNDIWTDLVSDYLDGELPPARKREMEQHLTECPECRALLEDLRLLVTRSRALPEVPPDRDLWPAIAARLAGEAPAPAVSTRPKPRVWTARRISFSIPQFAAACAAMLALVAGLAWYAFVRVPEQAHLASAKGSVPAVNADATQASTDHTAIHDIAELRKILASGRGRLAPATVRALEESLVIIDVAIRQAQRALEADPGNPYVKAHLNETMHRKIELMRRATQLASAP